MEENIICPYPGLRPFNEDESIFFKGREEHIEQIVHQLEEKKFLMLTGASGDGKSSLVYAGVIPHARAGFFKAKFNNWIIADFRPERDPLSNFAQALAVQLKINDIPKLEKELSYGFSSLIDLYKASPFWIDQQTDVFKQLSPEEQKKGKRKGANLLILVDQFEEFFTNIENYTNGKVSLESQVVVNLLLETTRIAIEQDIPIYIVCTMRSDYIGQCASFRGLPEYIGYSQFFVPRLKRNEIYQVIEEPALLNGNKISKRLVEMLINEMNDGIDQLPVLQHALNQIWQKAEKGQVEMDIIHFAKINGIPKNQLTPADREEFETWFETLPDFKKDLFANSSLGDVLDAHANELYQTAADNANIELDGSGISSEDAKLIVETTFKCLTKIDEARAVRNRMTLEEITAIINQPHIYEKTVAAVLKAFRKQGNTFLKPFITEDGLSQTITPKTVLDITHESLIRNWNNLTEWAKQEYDNLLTWQDFNKQLSRWLNNNKSSGYLLPIGSLTFFETWFLQSKPNAHWLARYDDREVSKEQKLIDAEKTLENANQFIKRSARRLFFSRTVIKYGADKLIGAFGVLLLVISCTYFYFDYRKKQNSAVISSIKQNGISLLQSKYIKNNVKANYILAAERLNPGSYEELLNLMDSDSSKLEILGSMLATCINYQHNNKIKNDPDELLMDEFFAKQLHLLEKKDIFYSNEEFIRNINNIMVIVYEHILINEQRVTLEDPTISMRYGAFQKKSYEAVLRMLNDTSSLKNIDANQFGKLMQIIPNLADYDKQKLKEVSDIFSPFDSKSKVKFDLLFPKEKEIPQNWNATVSHNGGYFYLTNLYALIGDFTHLNMSFDSLMFYNKNFLNETRAFSYNRILYALTISGNLCTAEGDKFVERIHSLLPSKRDFSMLIYLHNKLLMEGKESVGFYDLTNIVNNDNKANYFNTLIERISFKQLDDMGNYMITQTLNNSKLSEDEKKFTISLCYKNMALSYNLEKNYNKPKIVENLKAALGFYDKISKDYLAEDINISESGSKFIRRSDLFKYPGPISLFESWNIYNQWYLSSFKNLGVVVEYVDSVKGINSFYLSNPADAYVFNTFLVNYSAVQLTRLQKDNSDTIRLNPFISGMNSSVAGIDHDFINSFLTIYYYRTGKKGKAKAFSNKVNFDKLFTKQKITSDQNGYIYLQSASRLASYYMLSSDEQNDSSISTVMKIVSVLPSEYQKRNLLLSLVDSMQAANKIFSATSLLDTLLNTYIVKNPKYGNKLFELLGRYGTRDCSKMAMVLMKDKNDKAKPGCLNFFIKGLSRSEKYYSAFIAIPDYVSSSNQLILYTSIMKNELINKPGRKYGWFIMDTQDDWSSQPYEDSEGSNIYYSSEE